MVLARSRIRQKQEQTGAAAHAPRNPYLVMAVVVAFLGSLLVVMALVYNLWQRSAHEDAVKRARGLTLLDELDDLACDYYYNEKDKANNGRLPDEAWAPFRKYAEAGDVFDFMILTAQGATDSVADALFYRDGRAAGSQPVNFILGGYKYYGPPGAGPDPKLAQVQVVEGIVKIGESSRQVLFFRRPILHPKHGTAQYFGRAVVILYRDVPSPEPGSEGKTPPPAPTPTSTPAPAADPAKPAG